jgi:hypothetical protein
MSVIGRSRHKPENSGAGRATVLVGERIRSRGVLRCRKWSGIGNAADPRRPLAGPPPLRSHETLGFTGIPYCHDLSLIIAAAR